MTTAPQSRGMTKCQAAVMACLEDASVPLSAYEILARLRPQRPTIAIPTVYRSLSALLDLGLVHQIPTLHAWIRVPATTTHDPAILAICDDCGKVSIVSASETVAAVETAATADGFQPNRSVIEVHGRCNDCDSRAQET